MTQQLINVGTAANDGTGDSLRTAGQKINANLVELYGGQALDVGFDVILVAGQSNAVGKGDNLDATLDAGDARVLQLASSGSYAGAVIAGVDPLNHNGGIYAGKIGFAPAFARHYAASIAQNRRVLLVPAAVSGTGFTTGAGDWVAGNPGGVLYEQAVALANAAIQNGPNNRFAGVLWLQGESDVALTQSAYAAQLDALIDGLRARIANAAQSWFLVGSMTPEQNASSGAISAAHIATPTRKARCGYFAGQPGYTNAGDTQHWAAAGHRFLARSAFAALANARSNTAGAANPAVPAQVSGLAASMIASSSIKLAWTALGTQPLDYLVQYKASASGTWLTYQRPASATPGTTITGLIGGTSYDLRVAGVNESGVGTASAPLTATTTISLVLDSVATSAAAAFGLRKLRSAYTGSVLRVRRSSDNAEQDIGFSGANLDTAALLAFVGASNSGFISTWYDQSGNGRNAAQATAANQPRIVNTGVLEVQNGVVAAKFASAWMTQAAGYPASADVTLSVVANVGGASQNILGGNSNARTLWTGGAGGRLEVYWPGGPNVDETAVLSYNVLHALLYTFLTSSRAVALYRDGAASGAGTLNGQQGDTGIVLGALGPTGISPLNGYLSEAIVFAGALGAGDIGTAQTNQKSYFGTP